MAACVWACRKCKTYLAGLPHFDTVVDRRSLVLILNTKGLSEIENPRLQRKREKMNMYSFHASWQKGSDHCVPDALSRAPVQDAVAEDEVAEDDEEEDVLHQTVKAGLFAVCEDGTRLTPLQDQTLEKIRAAAARDPEYAALRDVIMTSFPEHRQDLHPPLRPYWSVRSMLTLDDGLVVYGPRLVIPQSLRRETLARLHDGHQGINRTKRRARQTVYWPGIDRDVENTAHSCCSCRRYAPSQPNEPLWQNDAPPSRVFESVSADYFHVAGRTYLVYVDRKSGWPHVVSCPRDTASAHHLTRVLRSVFADTSVPVLLRTDGGPQCTSSTVRRFLQRWGVRHQVSSPGYPRSNGHAESAVKSVKRLIQTTAAGGLDSDEFARALLELRNTPRADGRSPAQILFGHPLRSSVPAHRRAFAAEWQRKADECDTRATELREQAKTRHDASAHPLRPLHIGNVADIQDVTTKRWDRTGTIVGIGSRRTYLIKMVSGRTLWRNRRFLRPYRPLIIQHSAAPAASATPAAATAAATAVATAVAPGTASPTAALAPRDAAPPAAQAPRRGSRSRHQPDRLTVTWGTKT